MVEDGAFSHKIVLAILLNAWILPIGGASAVEGLRQGERFKYLLEERGQ